MLQFRKKKHNCLAVFSGCKLNTDLSVILDSLNVFSFISSWIEITRKRLLLAKSTTKAEKMRKEKTPADKRKIRWFFTGDGIIATKQKKEIN